MSCAVGDFAQHLGLLFFLGRCGSLILLYMYLIQTLTKYISALSSCCTYEWTLHKYSPTNIYCMTSGPQYVHNNSVTSASFLEVISPALKELSLSPLCYITEDNAIANVVDKKPGLDLPRSPRLFYNTSYTRKRLYTLFLMHTYPTIPISTSVTAGVDLSSLLANLTTCKKQNDSRSLTHVPCMPQAPKVQDSSKSSLFLRPIYIFLFRLKHK